MMEKPSPVAVLVTIGICTSALRSNVTAFIAKVSSLTNVTVRFIKLPYNDLDSFRLSSEGLDGLIICHSINNRRFAITNVMDALYDKFLPHVRRVFGKNNVCVIAHDFKWPMGRAGSSSEDHARIKNTHMDSFRYKQPTTFKCSKLVMICGRLDKQVDMDEVDWTQLDVFLHQCRVQPESWILYIFEYIILVILSKSYMGVQCVLDTGKYVVSFLAVQISEGTCVRSVLMLVCLPVMILLKTVDFIFSWTRSNGASHTMWRSFEHNVINRTLERSESYRGGWFVFVWKVYWICIIPFRLIFLSCWFFLGMPLVWLRDVAGEILITFQSPNKLQPTTGRPV